MRQKELDEFRPHSMHEHALNAAKQRDDKLRIEELSLRFSGIQALNCLSFTVKAGAICGLIGPNGAGKTSLFNCISRLYQPSQGRVIFDGKDITNCKPKDMAGLGIARTFQNLALFPSLTILENVMFGGDHYTRTGFVRALAVPVSRRREEAQLRDIAYLLLKQLGLESLALRRAEGLPYATLKKIELARALASRPTLLMLDEPAGGLSHAEVAALADTLLGVREQFNLTMLLVEHHMGMVMRVSDELVALNFGHKIASGKPAEVKIHPAVVEAYLGRPR